MISFRKWRHHNNNQSCHEPLIKPRTPSSYTWHKLYVYTTTRGTFNLHNITINNLIIDCCVLYNNQIYLQSLVHFLSLSFWVLYNNNIIIIRWFGGLFYSSNWKYGNITYWHLFTCKIAAAEVGGGGRKYILKRRTKRNCLSLTYSKYFLMYFFYNIYINKSFLLYIWKNWIRNQNCFFLLFLFKTSY